MNCAHVFLRERSKVLPNLLHTLTFVRSMGGGPRTFPGGLNKWKWKRLHEKRAREKERRLLEQEKQLYQARIRSQIRAELAGRQSQASPEKQRWDSNYVAMSPQEHVKALADRFMKEGAEDLWNENDGPIRTPPPDTPTYRNRLIHQRIDLRKMISDNREEGISEGSKDWSKPRNSSSYSGGRMRSGFHSFANGGDIISSKSLSNFSSLRCYSVCSRSKTMPSRFKFRRNGSSSSEDDWDSDDKNLGVVGGNEVGRNGRKLIPNSALGKYDVKITKRRIPLQFLEREDDVSYHVEAIREEFKKRDLEKNEEEKCEDESHLSQKRFDECNVSTLTVKSLTAAGFVQMTRVQEATLAAYFEGKDALVKAKTGTGKSAAFLLPAIETVLNALSSSTVQRVSQPIYVLILCPTRELASQLVAEANVLLRYHNGIGVQTLVGGTRFKDDQRRLESYPCQIIVATPGRLLDHIENRSGFSVRLMGLKMLVLDEADHLLDLGFRKDMEKIVDCLPRKRQSLLFSATIPKEVRRLSLLVLQREHAYVDMVGPGHLETHAKVKQAYLVAPHEEHFCLLHHLLKDHISQTLDYKIIVFCTTAMMASFTFSLLREMKLNVREMHSRKPQLYRTRISDEFKESRRLILITSDVSSRGMNYPDVTLVIQVGIPSDREQYIHRLGRTGREGKEGEGVLLIAPWEEYFLDELKDLPLVKLPALHLDPGARVKMENSITKIDTSIKEAAYHGWLGYYNSIREISRDKTTLVELANKFCESVGLKKPPALFRKTALKMGLKGIPGMQIRQ